MLAEDLETFKRAHFWADLTPIEDRFSSISQSCAAQYGFYHLPIGVNVMVDDTPVETVTEINGRYTIRQVSVPIGKSFVNMRFCSGDPASDCDCIESDDDEYTTNLITNESKATKTKLHSFYYASFQGLMSSPTYRLHVGYTQAADPWERRSIYRNIPRKEIYAELINFLKAEGIEYLCFILVERDNNNQVKDFKENFLPTTGFEVIFESELFNNRNHEDEDVSGYLRNYIVKVK